MTILDLQADVDQWIKKFGVRYFDEKTNALLLSEEIGELSRLIAREYGEQSFKPTKKPENVKEAIADEMSDILFVLVCLANQMDIDLESSMLKNMSKKTNRDHSRHKDNEKLK